MVPLSSFKPHQRELLSILGWYRARNLKPAEYVVLTGGVGTYKTTALCRLLAAHLYAYDLIYPRMVFGAVAKTHRQLERVFVKSFLDNVPPGRWDYNKVEKLLKPDNASNEITMIHADLEASEVARGENWVGYIMIQPETYRSFEMFDEAEARARTHDKKDDEGNVIAPCWARLKLFDFNAGSDDSRAYRIFMDDGGGQFIGGKLLESLVKPAYRWDLFEKLARLNIETTPQTSVYSAEFLATQQRILPTHEYDRKYRGIWCKGEGRIYDDYHILPEPVKPTQVHGIIMGIDPGTAHASENDGDYREGNLALIWLGELIDNPGTWAIVDERQIRFSGLDRLASLIEDVSTVWCKGDLKNNFQYWVGDWGGGSGEVFRQELPKRLDWLPPMLRPTGSEARSKWSPVPAGITLLIQLFKDRTIVLSPSVPLIQKDLARYSYDLKGEPDKKGYDPHLLDALRYASIRLGRSIGLKHVLPS